VDGVDAIADLQGSPIGLAVQSVARDRHKILLLSSSTSSEFTGKSCSPTTVQWTVDTYSLAVGAARAMTGVGGKRWFFLTVDQAYGHALTPSWAMPRSRPAAVISPRCCCRRNHPAPTFWPWPRPAATRSPR
jgi:hypothetical protein